MSDQQPAEPQPQADVIEVITPAAAAAAEKPRARLGPTEIVQLRDPHDSEDEDDEDKAPEGEARDDDFLADYPDDTEVSVAERSDATWCRRRGSCRTRGLLACASRSPASRPPCRSFAS